MHVASSEPARGSNARRSLPAAFALTLALSACGGSADPAKDASSQGPKQAPKMDIGLDLDEGRGAEAKLAEIPTKCSDEGGDLCVPPSDVARRICAARMPEIALALFAKGTPWSRGYLSRNTEAWDASGGPSGSNKLFFDEEVLILVRRAPNTGGMVVSGASGGYDVLRWDGTCASLTADEVRVRVPPEPLNAAIPWRKLDDEVQAKLLGDDRIAKLEGEQKAACKGLSRGQSNAKCDKAQLKLGKAVAAYVRRGGELPPPPKLP